MLKLKCVNGPLAIPVQPLKLLELSVSEVNEANW